MSGSRVKHLGILAPLLVAPEDSPLPTLDSTRLLARAAFEVATGQRPLPTWRGGPLGRASEAATR